MANVVQIQVSPEYVKFPRRCVCCARPDERDMEVAVSSTDTDERDDYVIMEVELPYCLECYQHTLQPSNRLRIVAVAVVLALIVTFAAGAEPHISLVVVVSGAVLFAAYLAWEWRNAKRLMFPSCSSKNRHVIFTDPTSSRITTMVFTNSTVADSVKELNRYNVVEQ